MAFHNRFFLSLPLLALAGCWGGMPAATSVEPVALSAPDIPQPPAEIEGREAHASATSAPLPVFPSGKAARPDDSYRLGRGDKIRFDVHNEKELSFEYEVPDSGQISYPWIGELILLNRTIEEVRQELHERLEKDFLVDPKVFIRVEEFKSKPVEIIGPVKTPGTYYLTSNVIDIIRLVALAGGFEENRGSYATVEHKDRRMAVSVDLTALVDRGELSWNRQIEPGDTVVISNRQFEDARNTQVTVTGEVRKTGPIAWQPGLTISNAIARAGGPTQYGAPSRTRVFRVNRDGTRETLKVDAEDIEESGGFELLPGDIVEIPQSAF